MAQVWSIRGTNGSGKTTLARRFIPVGAAPLTLIHWPSPTKKLPDRELPVVGYGRNSAALGRVVVVGPYSAACGGLDQVPCFEASRKAIQAAINLEAANHVVAEGLLASGVYGSWGEFSQEWCRPHGHTYNFVYCSTPLEVCKERVRARQRAAGKEGKEIKWEQVEGKYRQVVANRARALAAGEVVWDLPWEDQATVAEAMTAIMMGKGEAYRAQ